MIKICYATDFPMEIQAGFDATKRSVLIPPINEYDAREIGIDADAEKWDLVIAPDGRLFAFSDHAAYSEWLMSEMPKGSRLLVRFYRNEGSMPVAIIPHLSPTPSGPIEVTRDMEAFVPTSQNLPRSLTRYDGFPWHD